MKKVLLLLVALFTVFGFAACTPEEETVVTLDNLIVVTNATKTEYQLNETLDMTGFSVKAVFSDGTDRVLAASEYTVTGFSSTAIGEKTITVTYEGKTVTFTVLVFDATLPRELLVIQIISLPTKQTYAIGESFNNEGMEVEAVYNNGDRETTTEYTLSGFVTTAVLNDGVATITFGGKVATFGYKVREVIVQGVTETTITVGNTAATSGFFAAVGVPFNEGIKAYFKKINDAGGVAGRTLNFVTYDDTFNAETGLNYTKQLVEEDNVFALVGHFGTPTVGATLGYIQEVGVPMVYAATGINALYFEKAQGLGNPVMAVQPIYKTDGRIMAARALNESLFGANKDAKLASNAKIGVLYTPDDVGNSIKAGIEVQAIVETRVTSFVYKSFTVGDPSALNSAVLDLVASGVSAVIVASNQAPFKAAVGALNANGVTVPVFTSYVNADATSVDSAVTYGFDMYANAWLDIVDPAGVNGFSDAYWTFANDMIAAGQAGYAANAYAMAGYIAAAVFVEGLNRVDEETLTWESYIKAMESAPITIPMGGTIDYTEGKRWGIASMALLKLSLATGTPAWAKVRNIETITQIQAK
jgi:branched-chain amino acid transport system substrate-binding protein